MTSCYPKEPLYWPGKASGPAICLLPSLGAALAEFCGARPSVDADQSTFLGTVASPVCTFESTTAISEQYFTDSALYTMMLLRGIRSPDEKTGSNYQNRTSDLDDIIQFKE